MADLSKYLEQLQEFDVNNIDFNRVGVWPAPAKIFLCVLASAAIVAGCYFVFVKEKNLTLQTEQSKEVRLREDFKSKAYEAANLEKYREQMVKMRESFGALVSRLPTDTEVPGLIEDIDDKGVESSLEINKIELQNEVVSDIHVELPISISVSGGYHEFGSFVSGIAGMPRIVTLHNFSIQPENNNSGFLVMNLQAKTYRYKAEE